MLLFENEKSGRILPGNDFLCRLGKNHFFQTRKADFRGWKKQIFCLQTGQDKLYLYLRNCVERTADYGYLRTEIKTGILSGKSAF